MTVRAQRGWLWSLAGSCGVLSLLILGGGFLLPVDLAVEAEATSSAPDRSAALEVQQTGKGTDKIPSLKSMLALATIQGLNVKLDAEIEALRADPVPGRHTPLGGANRGAYPLCVTYPPPTRSRRQHSVVGHLMRPGAGHERCQALDEGRLWT